MRLTRSRQQNSIADVSKSDGAQFVQELMLVLRNSRKNGERNLVFERLTEEEGHRTSLEALRGEVFGLRVALNPSYKLVRVPVDEAFLWRETVDHCGVFRHRCVMMDDDPT